MFTKSTCRVIAGVLLIATAQPVLAALAAYEPFDYSSSIPNGTSSSATGFTGNWTCGTAPSMVAGLSYPDLPTANGALSSTSGRQSVSLADSLSSGTAWISFLFNMTGNNGGNHCGLYFLNGGTGLFFGYGLAPVSGTQGGLGLGSLSTAGTGPQPAADLASSFLGTYGTTPYLVALKIDFDTSGANDTITVYINPTADAATPDVTATYAVTTFDVGTITGIGFQNSGGGFPIVADEIRVGDSFADVVTENGVATPPAPVLTDVSPSSGLTDGGTEVTITGSNFLDGATVTFGPNPGTSVLLTSSNSLSATTPAGAPGAVNVVVANTNGLSATRFGGFVYLLPPLPPPVPVPGSLSVTGSNLTFAWMGTTNSTSVLLTTTNLVNESAWTPVATNIFGPEGLTTNNIIILPGDAHRVFSPSQPTPIVVVEAPTGLQTIPSGSTNAIGLAWTASATEDVVGYRIRYGLGSGNLINFVDVGNVTSATLFGLTPGLTYTLSVVALADGGQSPEEEAVITAQTDTTVSIIDLFNAGTPLEPPTTVDTTNALTTYVADRVRDRHAREDQFQAYDHYLSWYWEQRIARMEIIDRVGKPGQPQTITVNYTTLDRLNPAEFRAFFFGQTTEAQYHLNVIAPLVSITPSAIPGETDYNYSYTITQKLPENRALQVGDRMELEISMFLLGPRNGRNNYYGTAILYVVGQGIIPWEGLGPLQDSYPLPATAWLGGKTTVHYQYSNEPEHLFKQMAGNTAPINGQPFMLGRRLHHTDFGNGVHSEPDNPVFTPQIGKLGPNYIARSCVECHVNNGRALPPAAGANMFQTVMKVGADANGTPHPTLGSVVQPQNTSGPAEGSATIAGYTLINGQYGDGTPYELREPAYTFSGTTPSNYSARLAPSLVGMGLLEAVRESSVMALADPGDVDQDGISGRTQMVMDPETGQARLGRFGYKGASARVSHQVATALNTDMGVTTTVFPDLDGETTGGAPEISDADVDQITRYVALLGVQARRDLTDAQALQGEALFAGARCVDCHTPAFTTSPHHPLAELRDQTIQPYTDLLLHDMGPGLADNLGEGIATGAEWRTAPLWNIGHTPGVSQAGEAYLHDGRARTLEEAILWHGGEAEASKEAFRTMSATERAAVIKFLKSL